MRLNIIVRALMKKIPTLLIVILIAFITTIVTSALINFGQYSQNESQGPSSHTNLIKVIDAQRYLENGNYISWSLPAGNYSIQVESDAPVSIGIWDGDTMLIYKKKIYKYEDTFTTNLEFNIRIDNNGPFDANLRLLVEKTHEEPIIPYS
jgi:hypothetical protein